MADAAARTRNLLLAVGGAVAVGVAVVAAAPPPPGASTYAASGPGLLSAYEYLVARGHPAERWRRPLAELPAEPGGVLVIATPLSQPWTADDGDALRAFTDRGGRVVLALHGEEPDLQTAALLRSAELWPVSRSQDGPLWWGDWREWAVAPVALEATAEAAGDGAPTLLQGRRIRSAVAAPRRAQVLWSDPEGLPVAFRQDRGPGELVVLSDRSPLGNADLAAADNLAALEWLLADGGPIRFDEVHHGHLDEASLDLAGVVGPFELLLLHAGLLYLLWAWSTGRRFGPILDRPRHARSSLSAELTALAALHQRAGHASEAVDRLRALLRHRVRRRGAVPTDLEADLEPGPQHSGADEAALLALARKVGELQGRGLL